MSGTVSIESISFRNTLPMVLQQQQVTTPQWIRNVRSLPAAFANPGATLRLTVKLTSRTSRHAVRLRNRRVGGGLAAVGAMPERSVDFGGGTAATVHVRGTCHRSPCERRFGLLAVGVLRRRRMAGCGYKRASNLRSPWQIPRRPGTRRPRGGRWSGMRASARLAHERSMTRLPG